MRPILRLLPLLLLAAQEGSEARTLVEGLRSERIEARAEAERKLIMLGEPALGELEKVERDPDREVSTRAASAIRAIRRLKTLTPNSLKVLPSIRERLSGGDDRAWTRLFLEAVEQIGTKRRHPGLERDDLEPIAAAALRGAATKEERVTVCKAIATWRLRTAAPELIARLGVEDWDERTAALQALHPTRSGEALAPLVRAIETARSDAARKSSVVSLCLLRPTGSRPHLVNLLPVVQENTEILWALSDLDADEAIPTILHLLRAGRVDHGVAATVLGRLGPAQAVPGAVRMIEDEKEHVRTSGLNLLCGLRSKVAVPELLKLLKHPEPAWRLQAAGALVALGAPEGIPALKQLLEEPDARVARGAAGTLARLGDPEGLPQLLMMLRGKEEGDRKQALWAMIKLGSPIVIPDLHELVRQRDPLRGMAAHALGGTGSPEVLPDLLALAKDGSAEVRQEVAYGLSGIRSPESTKALLELLKDPEEVVRGAAVQGLAWLDARETAPQLVPLLKEPWQYIVFQTARTLADFGARESIPALLELLEREGAAPVAAYALSVLGAAEAIPPLRVLLSDRLLYVREGAAQALCRLGIRDGVPLLLDPRPWGVPFLELNALRRPDLWKTIAAARLDGILRGRVRDLLAELAVKLGLKLEIEPGLEERWLCERRDVRLRGVSPVDALRELMAGGSGPVLEPGVLRVLSRKETVRHWRRWWAEEGLKSAKAADREEGARTLAEIAGAEGDERERAAEEKARAASEPERRQARVAAVAQSLTPALRSIAGLVERLADGGDAAYAEVLLESQRQDKWALYRTLRPEDLDRLAPAALRGAATPQEKESVLNVIAGKRLAGARPETIRKLDDLSAPVRAAALRALVALGAKEEIPRIAALLGSPDSSTVSAALHALGGLEARDRLPAILALAREGDPAARLSAGSVLARWKRPEAIPVLMGLTKGAEYQTRRSVAFALSAFGGEAVGPSMRELLKDEDPTVVEVALNYLKWNGGKEATPEIVALLSRKGHFEGMIARAALEALRSLGAREAVPKVLPLLKHGDWSTAVSAAQFLVDMNVRESIPELRGILEKGEVHSTWIAGPALVEFGDRESLPQFKRLLQSKESHVRASAAEALAALQGREALPAIREALKDRESYTYALVEAQMRLAPEEAIPFLRERLKANGGDGLSGLMTLRQPEVRPFIEKWLEDPSAMTRAHGLTSLFQLDGRAALPTIRAALSDPEPYLAGTAAELLVRAGERDGVPILLRSGKNLFPLNAIRNPGLYERFSTKRLEEPFYGSAKEILERLARESGVTLESPAADSPRFKSWTNTYQRVGSRLKPPMVLAVLEQFGWSVILEKDRLLAVAPERAGELWAAWWQKEGDKK